MRCPISGPERPIRSAAIAALFPAGVVAYEMRDEGDPATLLSDEAACLRRAAPARLREFAAGRACARAGMREFGVVDFALRVGAAREPLWPDALVGSIAHTDGLCAAVVAERSRFAGLGLDCEPLDAVKPALWPKICDVRETAWLESLPADEQRRGATLLFAVKEAFYKAQFPLTGEWLGFHDVGVDVPQWDLQRGQTVLRANRAIVLEARAALPVTADYGFDARHVTAGIALTSRPSRPGTP